MLIPTLTRPKNFSKKYPDFPLGGVRHLIFNEKENGLKDAGAIVRVSGCVFIHEEKFFDWAVNSSNQVT